ncbi:MAG: FAD binding domain-containing protein [Elusimicrobia bacterium]|nr:FAD binding domain-containing protein [Elusimicrobiota bacterium]
MNNIKRYSFPRTPKAALSVLLNKKANAIAVAGGTLVARTLPETAETFLDLKNLPLNRIKKQGGDLVIGATATFDDIDNSKPTRSWAGGVLSRAAARCSSQLIRNMATIGGNIARPHSFNIFPAVLLGLDAEVKLLTRSGAKTCPFSGLYSPGIAPGRDSIILEVIIPARTKNWVCRFEKFAKTEASWEAYLTLFMGVKISNGSICAARVIVGALSPKPFRAALAEQVLTGARPNPGVIEEACLELARGLDAARPHKAEEFKKEVAASLLKRFLESLGCSGGRKPARM